HGWIERPAVDDYLTRLVIERLSRPDTYPHLPDGADESAVAALRAREAGLRAELDGYAEDAAEGRIDRVFASKVVGKLQAKITDVQRRVEQAITPPRWPVCSPVTPARTCPPAGTGHRPPRSGNYCGCCSPPSWSPRHPVRSTSAW
ncbi:MAG: hypothetical protein ACREX8_15730, partial [Gammaproteobacteria bacterium]